MLCRDSLVCIATSYGLAGPRIEFLSPKKAPEQWLAVLFPEGKSARISYASTRDPFCCEL